MTSGLIVALSALVTTVVMSASPSGGPAGASTATWSGGVLRSYQPSDAQIANPDRGMYHYTESHAWADGSGFAPLDAQTLTRWRTDEDVTVVYRVYYLERFTTQSLDTAYLQAVARDLDTARAAGVKLVLRFAYSASSSADATPALVRQHIDQLAPVLNASADVIATLQAGFIGQWGEWYYSDNFTSTPGEPWLLSDADWAARGSVLGELLQVTSPSIFVQVRYPEIKQRLLASAAPSISSRVGLHDDCFLASADDYGTFPQASDYQWLADQTRTEPMGGESCATNAPRSLWPSANTDLARYHWSFLNADYHPDVLASWGADGRAEAERRLGYRIRLLRGRYPTTIGASRSMSFSLTLTNDGYAAPYQPRPVNLVLRSTTHTTRRTLKLDVRTLAPGQSVTKTFTVSAPSKTGTYALYLSLPDPSARLATTPAYSVKLANAGLWVPSRGWNSLQQRLQVISE